MMMAQQQASFGTPSLTPTGSPALGPASDSTGLRRRKSHREKPDRVPADGEQAAPPPQAEAKVDDEPALTPEAAEAARAQAAVVRRRQENAQAVVQLTMFVLFLLFMGSGRDSSPSAWIPYIVLFAL